MKCISNFTFILKNQKQVYCCILHIRTRKLFEQMRTISLLSAMLIGISLFSQINISTDFELHPVGTAYERLKWQADGFTTATWDEGLLFRTVVDNSTSVSGQKSLRITYPAGQFGTANTGCQVPLEFTPQNEMYMSYNLRFSENFTWGTTSYGGKLPGLAGGANCSGGDDCSSGTQGFTARFMWRTGGKIILYLYHMDKPGTYGEDIDLTWPSGDDVVFEKGKWYHIMERVKINTNGTTYDGEVQVWVNGQEVLLLTGLRFTSNGDKVDNLYISTFHGGSDATWAPVETCYTWLDDVKISTNPENVEYKSCIGPDLGPDASICGTSYVTLDAHVSPVNASFSWLQNGVEVATSATYNATTIGEYVLIYDSLGCTRKDTIQVLSNLKPDLGADRTICNSSFLTLDANSAGASIAYQWKKDGVVLPDANARTLDVYEAGIYSVVASRAGCADATDEVVLSSGLLDIQGVSGNFGDPFSITVNETGTNYGWFDVASGVTSLASGKTYSSTIPSQDTYLYVQDLDGYSGLVGKRNAPVTWTDNRFDRRMKFQVFRTVRIDSITVYVVADQDVVIKILASDQTTVVATKTFSALTAGEQRLALHFELSAGIYYMSAEGSTGSLRYSYEVDTDIQFPYTVPGLISILGSNLAWIDAKPYYLFFYNWRVSAGNTCARTPVKIDVLNIVPKSQSIALNEGWNLVSLNVIPSNSEVNNVFPNAIVVKTDSMFYSATQSAFLNSLKNISSGMGYLMYNSKDEILEIIGQPIVITPTALRPGWNLVGVPVQSNYPVTDLPENIEIVKDFDGFFDTPWMMGEIESLLPGKAYFVKILEKNSIDW